MIRRLLSGAALALALSATASAQKTNSAGPLSQMQGASTPLSGTELMYIVQGGVSKKASVSALSFSQFLTIGTTPITGGAANDCLTIGSLSFLQANACLFSGGPLGTPSSGTLTNTTGLPISTGVSGLGTGVLPFLEQTGPVLIGSQTAGGGSPFGNSAILIPNTGPFIGGGSLTVDSFPFGYGSTATTACIQAFIPGNLGCPVMGGGAPNAYATAPMTERDANSLTYLIVGIGPRFSVSSPAQIIAPVAGTFTLGTFVPTSALSGGQVALLAQQMQLKTNDSPPCYGSLNNWQTNGTVLYNTVWQCGTPPNTFSAVPSGTTVEVDQDPAKMPGTFTSNTRFTFTTPLTPQQVALLAPGMGLDDNGVGNAQCSGTLTDYAANGTYVDASGGFWQHPTGTVQCTPSTGTAIIVSEVSKLFPSNSVVNLIPGSRATQFANEYDCNNGQRSYLYGVTGLAINNVQYMACLDLVNLSQYTAWAGLIVRGNGLAASEPPFVNDANLRAGAAFAGVNVDPLEGWPVPVAFSCTNSGGNNSINDCLRDWSAAGSPQNGPCPLCNIYAELPSLTGQLLLGNQAQGTTSPSAPGLYLFSSGLAAGNNAHYDVSLAASGGTGAPNSGTLLIGAATTVLSGALSAAGLSVDGSGNLVAASLGTTGAIHGGTANITGVVTVGSLAAQSGPFAVSSLGAVSGLSYASTNFSVNSSGALNAASLGSGGTINSAATSGNAYSSGGFAVSSAGALNAASLSSGGTINSTAASGNAFSSSGFGVTSAGALTSASLAATSGGITSPGFSVSSVGAVDATLPTSAGSGGLYVCVDTSGTFYKKSACP